MTPPPGLRFEFDWVPVDASVRAKELQATWARLEIWVGEYCVTLAQDLVTGSVRRSIVVPMYPVAEWLAFNWWQLLHDSRPALNPSGSVPSSHRLVSAGDGFSWPDLVVIPHGDGTLLRWSRRRPAGSSLDFVGEGQRRLPPDDLQQSMVRVLDSVLARLAESGLTDTPLQEEWARLTALDDEQAEFCEASARLGLDPFSAGLDVAHQIEAVAATLPAAVVDDLLDAADPKQLPEELAWMVSAADAASATDTTGLARAMELEPLRAALPGFHPSDGAVRPWQIGYEAARAVRAELGMAPEVPFPDEAPIRVEVQERSDGALQGLGRRPVGSGTANLVVPRVLRSTSRRFAVARSLWHLLAQRGDNPFLLTPAASTRQQIGRAFAAELLAPAEGIRRLLGPTRVAYSDAALTEVAFHYVTTDLVVSHQMENQAVA